MGSALFLLIRNGRPNAGQVIRLDGAEIDRYDDFQRFIAAMLDYTRADVDQIRSTESQD